MKKQTSIYDKITSKFSFNREKQKFGLLSSNPHKNEPKNTSADSLKNINLKSETSKNLEPSLVSYKELKNIIKSRRSIRQFTPYKPPYKIIFEIIQTSFNAPRAGNIPNTDYILIENSSKKATIANLCYQQSWIAQAPYILIVISSKDDISKLYPDMSLRFSTQNTAVQIQNLLLLIHSAGFSSCWVESFQEEVLKDFLAIPSNLEIHAVLPVGFAKEIVQAPTNPDLLMKIHFEKFGSKKLTL